MSSYVQSKKKKIIRSLDGACPSFTTKFFLASMEATEAGEAAEAENFPKNKYGSKCLELPNSARNQIKNFSPL